MSDGLICHALTKRFGGVTAIDNVSLTFRPGTVTALIGPNGAGKTTLFHLIGGYLGLDAGEISFRGKRLNGLDPWKIARAGIGRQFQDVRVFAQMSVLENVMTAFPDQTGENPAAALFRPRMVAREEAKRREAAQVVLETVSLQEHAAAAAGTLSHGQQKLLAIGRLLAGGADALLLDEPTAGVNAALIETLGVCVRGLAQSGRTVLLIEHNKEVVAGLADWVHVLEGGRVVASGLPGVVLSERSVRSGYLGL